MKELKLKGLENKCPCNNCLAHENCTEPKDCAKYLRWKVNNVMNDAFPSEEDLEEMQKLFLELIDKDEALCKDFDKAIQFAVNQELERREFEPKKTISIHCKPCYNYQSLEFDFILKDNLSNLPQLENIYLAFVQMLSRIAEKEPNLSNYPSKKESKPKEPLATAKQKDIMDKFKIPYTSATTQKEASALIQKSIDAE